jgi:hypothetical protein
MNPIDLNEAPPLTDDEEQEVAELYEERADHLDLLSRRWRRSEHAFARETGRDDDNHG